MRFRTLFPPRLSVALLILASGSSLHANLLRNGSFEEAPFGIQNGSGSFPGWYAVNYRYNYNYTTSSGPSSDGKYHYDIENGGRIETSSDSRVAVIPGVVYRMTFAAYKSRDGAATIWSGLNNAIEFYDGSGNLVRTTAGLPVEPSGASTSYQTFTLTKMAPAGAVTAGVKLELNAPYPYQDSQAFLIDAVTFDAVPETADTVDLFAAPRIVDAGGSSTVRVKYTATAAREILVHLEEAGVVLVEQRVAVGAGRGVQDVGVPSPTVLANAADYTWKTAIVVPGQPFGQALSAEHLDGITVNNVPLGSGNVTADSPYFLYSGRIDQSNPAAPVIIWNSSHIKCKFEGTSVQPTFFNPGTGSGDAVEFLVVIDGNDAGLTKFTLPPGGNGLIPLASGLAGGVHTLDIIRNSEVNVQYPSFRGLQLDAGCGLRQPEPFPDRRIAFFGDSITSASNPDPVVANPRPDNDDDWTVDMDHSYGPITARAIGADYQTTSKGATGVARSFVFSYVAKDYYDKQYFDVYNATDPANTTWDFTKWQAQFVVFNYGQNDAGRGAPASEYIPAIKDFLDRVRAAYPAAQVIVTIGEMAAGLGESAQLLEAVTEYRAANPTAQVDLIILETDGLIGGAHPHGPQHINMAMGSPYHQGLAEFITEKITTGLGQDFVPAVPLRNWRILQGLPADGSGDSGDPSGDGVPDLLKYAFNLAPNSGDLQRANATTLPPTNGTAGLPNFSRGAGQTQLVYVRRKAATDPGVSYVPEQSTDLKTWQPLAAAAQVTSIDNTWERVTLAVPTGLTAEFLHVRVVKA